MVVIVLSVMAWLTGVAGVLMGNYRKPKPWGHHKEWQTIVWQAHSWIARINILFGYAVTTGGVITYEMTYYEGHERYYFASMSLGVFLMMFIFAEITLQVW